MAYTKLPFSSTSDWVIGFQTINQATDNLLEHLAVLRFAHGTLDATDGLPTQRLTRSTGFHNDARIPRSVYRFEAANFTAGGGGGVLLQPSSQNVISAVEKTATGDYFARVAGLTTFWAVAEPHVASAADLRRVLATTYLPTWRGFPGIRLEAEQLVSGVWTKADFDFDVAVYGTTG